MLGQETAGIFLGLVCVIYGVLAMLWERNKRS
jgi:hypothetical protein